MSLKFVSKGLINNTPALVQILAGAKPFCESKMVNLLTYIHVTRPQSVNIRRIIGIKTYHVDIASS